MPSAAIARESMWVERLQRWKASGLTMRQFAAQEGIKASALSWWKWKLSRAERSAELGARKATLGGLTLVATQESKRSHDCPIEVVLAGARSVFVRRGFDADTLVQVIEALERVGAPSERVPPPAEPEVVPAEQSSCWAHTP